jgi:hypothetical protein
MLAPQMNCIGRCEEAPRRSSLLTGAEVASPKRLATTFVEKQGLFYIPFQLTGIHAQGIKILFDDLIAAFDLGGNESTLLCSGLIKATLLKRENPSEQLFWYIIVHHENYSSYRRFSNVLIGYVK